MPSVPWLSPSQMSVQAYRAPKPPASATPLRTSSTRMPRWPLPGWLSPAVLSMMTWGLARSSGFQPVPIRSGSSSGARVRIFWLIRFFITGFSFSLRLSICTLYAKKEMTSAARKPVKPTSVSMMVQVLRVVFSSRPTSDLTSQKPESLK